MNYLKKLLALIFGLALLSGNCYSYIDSYSELYGKSHSDSIDILHYTINLKITDLFNSRIEGNTEIKLLPKFENQENIQLDLLRLNIDSIKVDNNLVEEYSYNDTIIRIPLTNNYSLTDTITVTVYYNGVPKKDSKWGGFYFTSSCAYNMGIGMASEPVNFGRVWFPCNDDFIDRATYNYNITVKENHMAVCSGTLDSMTNNEKSTKTFHWSLRDNIPTYLSSVAVSDYIAVTGTYDGLLGQIPTYIYVNPEDSMSAVNSFVNLNNVLTVFENLFGPYPWERVGIVSVPFEAGAMEHVTNIALPESSINGTLNSEILFYHELSHHWFGDLVTCRTAGDMWLNEGWASYCEAIFLENIYGNKRFKDYVQDNHDKVLRTVHTSDDGYYALSGVPHEITYGKTVYDKGSDVVHTLRGYLGDSLFFESIKNYMNEFAFKDISSEDFRDFLTESTGIDMSGFFDAWVFTPGFPHYSIDSFNVVPSDQDYNVTVYVKQKLRARDNYANSNRLEITLMDENWNTLTKNIEFSGETGSSTFSSSINPKIILMDFDEKISDAISNNYQTVKENGINYFYNTYFNLIVDNIEDSAFINVEYNWVAPDDSNTMAGGLLISGYNYWKISGVLPENFDTRGKFYYHITAYSSNDKKNSFTVNDNDSLVLVYRKGAGHKWQEISQTLVGFYLTGEILVDSFQLGEYALAIWKWDTGIEILDDSGNSDNYLWVFPNPSNDHFTINFELNDTGQINIYDIKGSLILNKTIKKDEKQITWKPNNNNKGIYIIELSEKGRIVARKKIKYD
ncbi:MAG: T9SS type A sorting domain-containing protein [Bacteroidales bacterium]|nr:T9SS type A sorting domain-containing protein [Bacteroidales bacterium]